jgi:hypothetical protein
VRRRDHVILERLNCFYCDYALGVLGYVREVTGATEHFWCPVKHKQNYHGQTGKYENFIAQDETQDFRKKLWAERVNCRACKVQGECDKS